jgi:signal transduction histidine kinase/CheY-like chemotaxis protein
MQKKGLTLFEWLVKTLIGNPEDYSLEHRFFIAACFVGGMAGLLASVINLSISLHPALIFTTAGIAIIYFSFYYISLKQKKYKGLILPYIFISLLAISYIWFINGGSYGPVSFILFTALLVYIVLTHGASRITAIAVVAITLSVLYIWEYLHPELIVPYADAKSRFIDVYFTALFSVGLIAFIASFIMKNYRDEREKVIRQWNTILEQNKEIKNAEKELLKYQENLEELVRQRTRELEESNIQLIKAKDKAEESDRLKTAFLSNMSHEIRTPMNAIVGFSYLLREKGLSSQTRNHYIDIITAKGNLLMHIINDIIDISKVEAGEIDITISACNIDEMMNDLYSTFAGVLESAQKTHIELKLIPSEKDENIITLTDPYRLKQILTNLLDNATKFTHKGFVEFGYNLIPEEDPKEIKFFVRDSGIGISEENTEFIFTRFRQIDESHTREYGGTGLGLSISKKLVELLGGSLELESVFGTGSTFLFSIPYEPVEINSQTITKHEDNNKTYNWNNKTILIVEDNYPGFVLLQNHLKHTKAKLIHVSNGIDAVNICKSKPDIDLVLMDIQLPEMNGFEATAIIKKHRKDLPVIAETAYAMAENALQAKKAGCDDFLTKPIVKDKLLSVLCKYLNP